MNHNPVLNYTTALLEQNGAFIVDTIEEGMILVLSFLAGSSFSLHKDQIDSNWSIQI